MAKVKLICPKLNTGSINFGRGSKKYAVEVAEGKVIEVEDGDINQKHWALGFTVFNDAENAAAKSPDEPKPQTKQAAETKPAQPKPSE